MFFCLRSEICHNFFFFFFNVPATPEIYPLPLHDALRICLKASKPRSRTTSAAVAATAAAATPATPSIRSQAPTKTSQSGQRTHQQTIQKRAGRTRRATRSEEHTSELQSQSNLVCRLLLEK